MDVRTRRIVFDIGQAEGAKAHQELAAVIRRERARGLALSPELLRFAERFGAAVHDSAGSAQLPQMPRPGPRGTSGRFRSEPSVSSSAQPVTLSIREAAHLAGCSEGFMRRACRRGDVQASRAGPQSAWAVDIAGLAAWMGSRHRKQQRKAA